MSRWQRAYAPLLIISLGVSVALAAIAVVEVLYLLLDLQASFSLIGSILGPAALGFILFAPQVRAMAERIGRGKFLLWSSLILACSCLAAALIGNAGMYLAPKVVIALLGPISVPVVLDGVAEQFRFLRSRDTLLFLVALTSTIGTAVGAWLSGIIAAETVLSAGYIIGAVGFAISAVASFFVDSKPQPRYRMNMKSHPLAHIADVMTSRFAILGGVVFSLQLFWAVRDFTLPVLLFDMGYNLVAVGVAFSVFSIGAIVSMLLFRQLLAINDAKGLLTLALALMAVSSFVLPFGNLTLIFFCCLFFGIGSGGVIACIADIVAREASGSSGEPVMMALGTVGGLAWLGGPIVVGIFLEAGVSSRVLLGGASLVLCYVFSAARAQWVRSGYLPRISWRADKKFDWL